jgi:hypothetical protein
LPIHVHVRWISGVAQLTRKLLVEVASARARPFGEIEAALDPVPQALQMNVPDSPLASARANERVVIGTPFKEADAASHLGQILLSRGRRLCIVQLQQRLRGGVAHGRGPWRHLAHAELAPAELHHVALAQAVASVKSASRTGSASVEL